MAIDWGHIIEREVIHFFSAGSCYVIALITLRFFERKSPYWYKATIPALVAAGLIFLREPMDVAVGGWVGKSYFDYTFWMLGFAAIIYGLHRLGSFK